METPDGTKWAAKNPKKAAKTLKLKEKLSRKKNTAKKAPTNDFSHTARNIDDIQHGAWVMEDHAFISEDKKNRSDIVLDTGATHHIFCDKTLFVSISKTSKSISTASGEHISVSVIGSARFRVYNYLDKNESKMIEVEDAWYVPSCTKNLVSGLRLISKGFNIMSSNGGISVISRTGSVVATAKTKEGLFCFNTNSSIYSFCSDSYGSQNALVSGDIQRTTSQLIHQRFAHVSPNILEKVEISDLKLPALRGYKNLSDLCIDRAILS